MTKSTQENYHSSDTKMTRLQSKSIINCWSLIPVNRQNLIMMSIETTPCHSGELRSVLYEPFTEKRPYSKEVWLPGITWHVSRQVSSASPIDWKYYKGESDLNLTLLPLFTFWAQRALLRSEHKSSKRVRFKLHYTNGQKVGAKLYI